MEPVRGVISSSRKGNKQTCGNRISREAIAPQLQNRRGRLPRRRATKLRARQRLPAREPQQRTGEQATIGKSLVVKGEVTGSESLYIDGKVEGAINLPGNRVTVGRNGQVAANIVAREVVVLGKVRGNCQASDRVDIRSEGSLTGDVIAARISIEDGAFFKGGIDIRKPGGTDLKGGPAQSASTPSRSQWKRKQIDLRAASAFAGAVLFVADVTSMHFART